MNKITYILSLFICFATASIQAQRPTQMASFTFSLLGHMGQHALQPSDMGFALAGEYERSLLKENWRWYALAEYSRIGNISRAYPWGHAIYPEQEIDFDFYENGDESITHRSLTQGLRVAVGLKYLPIYTKDPLVNPYLELNMGAMYVFTLAKDHQPTARNNNVVGGSRQVLTDQILPVAYMGGGLEFGKEGSLWKWGLSAGWLQGLSPYTMVQDIELVVDAKPVYELKKVKPQSLLLNMKLSLVF